MFLYCPIQYFTGLLFALLSEKAIFSSFDVKAALGYLPLGPVFFSHTLLKHDSAHAIHMNCGVFGLWAWYRLLSVIAPFHWAALKRFLEFTGYLSCCVWAQSAKRCSQSLNSRWLNSRPLVLGQWLWVVSDWRQPPIRSLSYILFGLFFIYSLSLRDPVPLKFDLKLPLLEYFVLNAFARLKQITITMLKFNSTCGFILFASTPVLHRGVFNTEVSAVGKAELTPAFFFFSVDPVDVRRIRRLERRCCEIG